MKKQMYSLFLAGTSNGNASAGYTFSVVDGRVNCPSWECSDLNPSEWYGIPDPLGSAARSETAQMLMNLMA